MREREELSILRFFIWIIWRMVLLFKEREYIEGKLSLRVERRIGVWIGIYYVCYNYYIIGC